MNKGVLARTKAAVAFTGFLTFGSLAAVTGEQLRRLLRAREHGKTALPASSHTPPGSVRRVLVVGDSTGAGVGCETPAESVAGRLAKGFPQVEVQNVSVSGATVAGVVEHVKALPQEPYRDLALVFAGGNDVLRRTAQPVLRQSVRELLDELHGRAGSIIWAGMANVGLAPAFLPPFSWWLTYRTRRVSGLLAEESARRGAQFVDFFHERDSDPFSSVPERFYAVDGIHPSAQAYEYCYQRMKPLISSALGLPPEHGPGAESRVTGGRDCEGGPPYVA